MVICRWFGVVSLLGSGLCFSAAEVANLSDGYEEADADSYYSVMSRDGRFVAFQSSASNLVDGDDDELQDIFVRDRRQQTTTLVSASLSGGSASGISSQIDMSDDGRFVVWESNATDLVADDTNGTWDCFLWDRNGGDILRLSTTENGSQSDRRSGSPAITGNGDYVVFQSQAGLTAGDGNEVEDVYRLNLETGARRLVSVAADGAPGNGGSSMPRISADGRMVVFVSAADNLVAGDTNGVSDIFVKDMDRGTVIRVSASANGAEADRSSTLPAIDPSGRYVAFASHATNLSNSDGASNRDLYLHDLRTGDVSLVTRGLSGAVGEGVRQKRSGTRGPARFALDEPALYFHASADDLVRSDLNGFSDVFRYDLRGGALQRVVVTTGEGELYGDCFVPMAIDRDLYTASCDSGFADDDGRSIRDILAVGDVRSIQTQ